MTFDVSKARHKLAKQITEVRTSRDYSQKETATVTMSGDYINSALE